MLNRHHSSRSVVSSGCKQQVPAVWRDFACTRLVQVQSILEINESVWFCNVHLDVAVFNGLYFMAINQIWQLCAGS